MRSTHATQVRACGFMLYTWRAWHHMAWHGMHERFPKHIFQVGLVWRNNHSVWVVTTEQGIDGRSQSCARLLQPKRCWGWPEAHAAAMRFAMRAARRCRGLPEAPSRYTRSSGRTGSRDRCCCHAVASGPRVRAGRSRSSSSIACTQTRAAIARGLKEPRWPGQYAATVRLGRFVDWRSSSGSASAVAACVAVSHVPRGSKG
jgi:hypothetical protein